MISDVSIFNAISRIRVENMSRKKQRENRRKAIVTGHIYDDGASRDSIMRICRRAGKIVAQGIDNHNAARYRSIVEGLTLYEIDGIRCLFCSLSSDVILSLGYVSLGYHPKYGHLIERVGK